MTAEQEKQLVEYVKNLNNRIQALETDNAEYKKKIKTLETKSREADLISIKFQQLLKTATVKINHLKDRISSLESSFRYKK